MKAKKETLTQGRVLEITETFNTTPKRLFKAWTNQRDFAAWFGPEGFEVTHCELDARVGGKWRTCIVSEDGDEYWMEGKYIEMIEGERLVFTYNDGSENKNPDHETVVTIIFSKSGNQTIMNFNQSVFSTVEARDSHRSGWSSAFVCLNALVEKK